MPISGPEALLRNIEHVPELLLDVFQEILDHKAIVLEYSGGPHIRLSLWGGMVPLDLRFRGPLEAKSFVGAPKIYPPGGPGKGLRS